MKNNAANCDSAPQIRAIITDWAGTIVDFGSLAPVTAVKEVFRNEGVRITDEEARGPMGRAKRDHLAAVAALPRINPLWAAALGRTPVDGDIDRIYGEFLPLQKQVLSQLSDVITGVPATVSRLRERGLKIASTTGYTRELMNIVTALARSQGLDIDIVLTANDVPAGRPAPWMIFQAAQQLGIYPMAAVVAVDDTPVGIQAARNAGAWAVAVARTGNELGLSERAAMALSTQEWNRHRECTEKTMLAAGAHFVIDGFSDLEGVIDQINARLRDGIIP